MIRQSIYLKEWDWLCRVFYEATPYDADEVCECLESIGCNEDDLRDARTNMLEGHFNTGFTYTNMKKGVSVVVISKTTSADEFQSTFDHEKGHLAMHICSALGISPFGEEFQYLVGEIGKQMFAKAKVLLCEQCRKKAGI